MSDYIIRAKGIKKYFGGVKALDDCRFSTPIFSWILIILSLIKIKFSVIV